MLERVGKDNLLITNISDADASEWLGDGKITTDARPVSARELDKSKVCLLDMRGELPLSAADAGKCKCRICASIQTDTSKGMVYA